MMARPDALRSRLLTATLPGRQRHQTLLRAVLAAYAADLSIQTIGVFGSVARDDCDERSDIDLDVVVFPEALPEALGKIQHLIDHLNAHGLPVLLTAWDEDEASAEILLASFDRLDITLHASQTSKSEVLRDLILICGNRDELPVQGIAAITPARAETRLNHLHGKLPILALYAADKLQHGKLWSALMGLQSMRDAVIEIYGLAHGSTLPHRFFAKEAPSDLRERLAASLATYDVPSIAAGLEILADFYCTQYNQISNGRLVIREEHLFAFEQAISVLRAL
jgi:predicted nucleotidyltransferase